LWRVRALEDRGGEDVIGYMSLEEQVEKDFLRARHRAFFGRLAARIRGDRRATTSGLLAFEEVRREMRADNRFYVGRRVVEVSKIVGSVDRHREFDRGFMPLNKGSMGWKWKRVDRAFHRGAELPPVRLYKLGEAYFVEDGNHRVSVSRYQGVEMIDAEVTEFYPRLSANLGTVRPHRDVQAPLGREQRTAEMCAPVLAASLAPWHGQVVGSVMRALSAGRG
jgi:hypothetical protein